MFWFTVRLKLAGRIRPEPSYFSPGRRLLPDPFRCESVVPRAVVVVVEDENRWQNKGISSF